MEANNTTVLQIWHKILSRCPSFFPIILHPSSQSLHHPSWTPPTTEQQIQSCRLIDSYPASSDPSGAVRTNHTPNISGEWAIEARLGEGSGRSIPVGSTKRGGATNSDGDGLWWLSLKFVVIIWQMIRSVVGLPFLEVKLGRGYRMCRSPEFLIAPLWRRMRVLSRTWVEERF